MTEQADHPTRIEAIETAFRFMDDDSLAPSYSRETRRAVVVNFCRQCGMSSVRELSLQDRQELMRVIKALLEVYYDYLP